MAFVMRHMFNRNYFWYLSFNFQYQSKSQCFLPRQVIYKKKYKSFQTIDSMWCDAWGETPSMNTTLDCNHAMQINTEIQLRNNTESLKSSVCLTNFHEPHRWKSVMNIWLGSVNIDLLVCVLGEFKLLLYSSLNNIPISPYSSGLHH